MVLLDLPEPLLLRDVMVTYGEPSHMLAYKFMGIHGDGLFYFLSMFYSADRFLIKAGFLHRRKPILNADL